MDTRRIVGLGWALLLVPVAAAAQTLVSGSIAGVVRDASGSVLPGVTVEAASPALIEKARVVITDGQGLYRITELRPGTYTVTFMLPGFQTFRREGIELTTAFTARVDAELAVGAIEETVTVSGAAPLVDTANVMQRMTFTPETLDRLPTGRALGQYMALIPSASGRLGDIDPAGGGGTSGEQGQAWGARGARWQDIVVLQDGMESNHGPTGANANNTLSINRSSVEEVTVQIGSNSAETAYGGVLVNYVPRAGGNAFQGTVDAGYANEDMAQNNVSDALRARRLPNQPNVKLTYEVSGALGGRIKRDKLWFFTAHRRWIGQRYQAGNFWNGTQNTLLYTPDLSRPVHTDDIYQNHLGRLTWQVTTKSKIIGGWDSQHTCACMSQLFEFFGSPETHPQQDWSPNEWGQATWTHTATNRLLFEAGVLYRNTGTKAKPQPGVTEDANPVTELSTNYLYRSSGSTTGATAYRNERNFSSQQRFSVSYVTGAHSLKVGMSLNEGWGFDTGRRVLGGGVAYEFRNQVPVSLVQFVNDIERIDDASVLLSGLFAQDQWTIRRLTLNLGVRYDALTRNFPANRVPAGRFVGERVSAAVDDQPNWKDLAPRVGGAYDLFGTGRTAVKAFAGRYVQRGVGAGRSLLGTIVGNTRRTWTDANGNFTPDCELTNVLANGECGQVSNLAFGSTRAAGRDDPDIVEGWFKRPANWEVTLSVQHELRPGLGVEVGYFRRMFGNFYVTDNLRVTSADYDQYCVTAPADPRLPGGGGNQICGLYDIKPAKFGQVDELQTFASNFGEQSDSFNGVEATMNWRFGRGLLAGGVSTGAQVTDNCDVLAHRDSPQRQFCRVSPPWSADTNVKLSAVYPLPWDLETSVIFQNLPGIPISASHVVTNAEIAPTLGRNLAAGARATTTIQLMDPASTYEDRRTNLDLRFSRVFRVRTARVQGNLDVFNVFNSSPILSINTRYGPQWLQPRQILPGRMFKLGVQLAF